MIRAFRLADFLILGNAACGAAAVFCLIIYAQVRSLAYFCGAAALILAALAFDVLDGRVARLRREHSALGH